MVSRVRAIYIHDVVCPKNRIWWKLPYIRNSINNFAISPDVLNLGCVLLCNKLLCF